MLCKLRFLILPFIAIMLITACSKEAQQDVVQVNDEEAIIAEYQYYFDGEKVSEEFFNPEDENLLIGITGEPSTNPDEGLIKIWAFTSKEKYIDWGYAHNTPVARMFEMHDHLRAYIEENRVEEIYEQTGELPQWYLDYELAYRESMLGESAVQRATAMLHKDCIGGASSPLVATLPVMWPGWNNRVSSYFPFGVYSGLSIFDRWLYRRYMATIFNWGWTRYCFSGPLGFLNDRMSSVF